MRTSRWIAVGLLAAVAVMVLAILPRSRSLPGGYTYTYFPRGGHRYIIAPGGIKKVGQEVLSYRVDGAMVSGTVSGVNLAARIFAHSGAPPSLSAAVGEAQRWSDAP